MEKRSKIYLQSRRDFLRSIAVAGSAFSFGSSPVLASIIKDDKKEIQPGNFHYKYKTISAKNVYQLKPWFDKLKENGSISDNEIFRGYINNFVFDPEKILPGAKSIIILAMPLKLASITFHLNGNAYDILIPTDYWDDGATLDGIKARIMKDIIRDETKKLEIQVKLPLKTIAVRSGLAKHGRNNITYVDGYGSFHRLIGLYSDLELEDNWGPLDMLHFCKGCNLCYNNCPTNAISKENFVIDANNCITLYNERSEPFPEWIKPESHNTLVGCLKCQWECPANQEGINDIVNLGSLTERETIFVLNKENDSAMHKKIINKLPKFPYAADLDYFSRNLNAAIKNASPRII